MSALGDLNADFSARAAVHGERARWIPSPMAGVDRIPLDRIGGEIARATSIVRYAPGSAFSPHTHDGGEEFLVLDGVFQDEHGDFEAGAYARNPPTSRHTPSSAPGCVILVKLWQFDLADRHALRVDRAALRFESIGTGAEAALLHQDARERVEIQRWSPSASIQRPAMGGVELFVLRGGFVEAGEAFGRWSWLRLPSNAPLRAAAGPEGAELWVKFGHLRETPSGPA